MPARTGTLLKVLNNTRRQDREPKRPTRPQPGRARCPKWLPSAERSAFRALATTAEATGLATGSFPHVLAGAAVAWVSLQRSTETLARVGETYETTSTNGALKVVERPEVESRNKALRLLRAYLSELGLTPAALGRVDLAKLPAPRSDNPFSELQ